MTALAAKTITTLLSRRSCCDSSERVARKLVTAVNTLCGHELTNRADDDEATILRRLEVYVRETKPLVLYFWERGLLRDIDAEAPEEVVADRTIEAIVGLLDTYE